MLFEYVRFANHRMKSSQTCCSCHFMSILQGISHLEAKTLVWSFLLCFLVMSVWSMLMVEMIHPLLQELSTFGILSHCRGSCERAMATVMDANLLLFKTVIAGDSWGEIAVPVIEQYPATAVIFMGSLLTLVFGVLNLIVALLQNSLNTSSLVFKVLLG